MRVLFIPSWFPSESNPHAGNFIQRLAIDLSERGIDIVVLHFDYQYKDLSIHKHEKKVLNERLVIHHFTGFQIPKFNMLAQQRWIKSCLNETEKTITNWNFDCIHSHDYIGSFVGSKIAERKNIKHVINLHHSDFIERSIHSWRVKLLYRIFENAHLIITPSSEFTKIVKEDYRIDANTIPHYIYWKSFIKTKSSKELKAISVTSIEAVKNNTGLINFCIQNNIAIDIYGNIEKKLAKRLPKNILSKGKISFLDLQEKYQDYDFLISFSEIETFGLSILEAHSHGLPVLVKNKIGAIDLVNKNNGKFINNDFDYKSFIQNLENYEAKKISKEAHQKFNKENVMNKYIEVYS